MAKSHQYHYHQPFTPSSTQHLRSCEYPAVLQAAFIARTSKCMSATYIHHIDLSFFISCAINSWSPKMSRRNSPNTQTISTLFSCHFWGRSFPPEIHAIYLMPPDCQVR